MEYMPPAEANQIYIDGDEERQKGLDVVYDKWFKYQLGEYSHPLADNVIALIVSPRESLEDPDDPDVGKAFRDIAPKYAYNSNDTDPKFVQQVPPLIKVTLVALDETSAIRMGEGGEEVSMPDFTFFGDFSMVRNYDRDLTALKLELNAKKLNYKVFSTIVAIRSSKWSTEVAGNPIAP